VFLKEEKKCVIVGGEVRNVEVVEHNEPKSRVKGQRAMRMVDGLFSPPHKHHAFVFLSQCKFPFSPSTRVLSNITAHKLEIMSKPRTRNWTKLK